MPRLSDLLDKLKSKGEEYVPLPEKKRIGSPEWEKCKEEIDKLSTNYEMVMTKYKEYSSKKKSGKYMRIQVNLGEIGGFDTQLVIYDGEHDTQAWYVAFNPQEMTAYRRILS